MPAAASSRPTALTPTIGAAVKGIHPVAAVYNITPMTTYLAQSIADARFDMALLLTTVGIRRLCAHHDGHSAVDPSPRLERRLGDGDVELRVDVLRRSASVDVRGDTNDAFRRGSSGEPSQHDTRLPIAFS